jgi:hypothetical protein
VPLLRRQGSVRLNSTVRNWLHSVSWHANTYVLSSSPQFSFYRRCAIRRTEVPTNLTVAVVTVACPSGFVGSITLECGGSGWLSKYAQAQALGVCTRKRCPRLEFNFTVNESNGRRTDAVQVSFPDTAEGDGQVTVRCPAGYDGSGVSAVCEPERAAWSQPQIRCRQRVS